MACSPSVLELRSSFNISNERLALLGTTLLIESVSCWFRRSAGASTIVFTLVKVMQCRELANARSPPFFELCGSNKFRCFPSAPGSSPGKVPALVVVPCARSDLLCR